MWPRDLPEHESGAAARSCGDGLSLPEVGGKQGVRTDLRRRGAMSDAAGPADGDEQGRGQSWLRVLLLCAASDYVELCLADARFAC
jgi:hypothetical protein